MIALSYNYNQFLLRVQATIFPKIVLLDQDIEKKISGNTVNISIVSKVDDIHVAHQLSELLVDKYGKKYDRKKGDIEK